MKTSKFKYDVSVEVDFTDEELDIIEQCATHHYDATVVSSVKHGGFFYGWKNFVRMGKEACLPDVPLICKFHELDLCGKAIEIPTSGDESEATHKARIDLRLAILKILASINKESEFMNHV